MGQPEFSNPRKSLAVKKIVNSAASTAIKPRIQQRLMGKVALILGSDSRLDRKIASVYAQQGACIVLCGLHLRRGRAVAAQLTAAGADVRFMLTDMADASDVRRAVEEAVSTYGQLDILINNCQPLAQPGTSVQTLSPALWNRTLDVTLGGPFLSVRHALPFLIRSEVASVINIAPLPDRGAGLATAMSQMGLASMTDNMSRSLLDHDIRVNLIWAGQQSLPARYLGMPVYRLGQQRQRPERAIARAALYLACADSQPLSGSTLWVRSQPLARHNQRRPTRRATGHSSCSGSSSLRS